MSPKKESKKKTAKTAPREEKVKILEIKLTSEIRRALELIRLPDETDEAAIARALHESFEYSLIRNVITQIDERLEGIISTKVEEEIVEANEDIEVEAGSVPAEAAVPETIEDEDVVPDLDDMADAITEEIESYKEDEEPEIPPALAQPKHPAPEIDEPKIPEIKKSEPSDTVQKPPASTPSIRPPAMASKADIDGPTPEVRLMKRNLEKKWLNTGDGV